MDAIRKTRDALAAGELRASDLTARGLGAFLGKTSSVLYRRWGSVEGFLHAVGQDGFRMLGDRLIGASVAGLPGVAEAYVAFGLDHAELYHLMFERRYDWEALRAAGSLSELPGLVLWRTGIDTLREAGSAAPEDDARVLFASLHGLVSLALSGRANVGDLSITDREAAVRSARRLAAWLESGGTPERAT